MGDGGKGRARRVTIEPTRRLVWFAIVLALLGAAPARATQTIRVVAYNIEADIGGYTTPRNGLATVLEAIGEVAVNGAAHPVDILALEETTSNTATVAPIVSALNGYYGAGTYALVSYQATQRGSASSGNGPNALVYNTTTVQIVPQNGAQAVGVPGTPSSSGGAPRQVVRYEFLPVSGKTGNQFYVYVTHSKSSAGGVESTNEASRNTEAQLIHNDIAALPANGGVLCMGDFNENGSTEAAYQTLTTPGAGQLLDPLNHDPQDNTQTWNTSAYLAWLSESATDLRYRDDIQFMSPDVLHGTSATGLHYVSGSSYAFGNNGSVGLYGSVNSSTNTALDGLQGPVTPAAARAALVTASDHLPLMTDYTVATPYNTWQAQHFSAGELADLTVSGDTADPDGDGIPNLLEYALNLDPRAPGTVGLPAIGTTAVNSDTYLTLTYTAVVAATDISYLPQISGDLVTWTSGGSAFVTFSIIPNADGTTQTVVVRDTKPVPAAGTRFLRLLVTRP